MASGYKAPRVAGTVTVSNVVTGTSSAQSAATAGGSLFPQSHSGTATSGAQAFATHMQAQTESQSYYTPYQHASPQTALVAAPNTSHADGSALLRVEQKVDSLSHEMRALREENAQLRELLMGLSVLEPLASRVDALTSLVKSISKVPRALPAAGVGVSSGADHSAASLTDAASEAPESQMPKPKSSNGKLKVWVGSWNVGAEVRGELPSADFTLGANSTASSLHCCVVYRTHSTT